MFCYIIKPNYREVKFKTDFVSKSAVLHVLIFHWKMASPECLGGGNFIEKLGFSHENNSWMKKSVICDIYYIQLADCISRHANRLRGRSPYLTMGKSSPIGWNFPPWIQHVLFSLAKRKMQSHDLPSMKMFSSERVHLFEIYKAPTNKKCFQTFIHGM